MTREEAVERLWCPAPPQDWAMAKTNAEHFIDQLVALGLITLEEPKSARELAAGLIEARITEVGGNFPALEAEAILLRLEKSNLKIVEK